MGLALLYAYRSQTPSVPNIPYSTAINEIQGGQVKTVTLIGNKATIELASGQKQQTTTGEKSENLEKVVVDYNSANPTRAVDFKCAETGQPFSVMGSILLSLLPVLLIGGFFFYMMRQAQGTNNQALSFGKSRARMFIGNKPTVTFDDVAGVEEAKQELTEVVEFLKYPEKFSSLGARIPRGVLLVGPPGTGKTMLARAVAGEAGVPFFSISGSEFVEMFVGVGASRVRDLFDQAKRNAPCIVFIDEIDAVGRQRGADLGGAHDEREQTWNKILVEMDGFDTGTTVSVVAATNRPDVLDPALLRPGRFDRQVVLDRPDIKGRKAILDVHVRGKPLDKNVDLLRIGQISPGFSGADLANVVNEAAILAARRNKKQIGQIDFEEAMEKAGEMAGQMDTKLGMSEKLGPLQYGKTDELIFRGRQTQEERNSSEEVAKIIDSEAHDIVDRARQRAYEVLTTNREKLDLIVSKLIEQETLEADEFNKLFEAPEEGLPVAASTPGPDATPPGAPAGEDRRPEKGEKGKGPAPAPTPA